MMINNKLRTGLIILLIIGCFFGSIIFISFVMVPIVLTPHSTYFPLGINTTWEYQSTDNVSSWTTKRSIEEDYEFIGLQFCVLFTEKHDEVWQNQMWLSKDYDSLVWWGFEDQNAKYIANNGLTYVVEPIVVGDSRGGTTSGSLTIYGNSPQTIIADFSGEYTVDKIEDVEVPAGIFKDCIKVHEVEYTPDGIADFYVWYAPHVGPIKYEYPNRNEREDILIQYNIVDDDPFESWLLPKVPYLIIATIVGVVITTVVVNVLKKRSKK